MGVSAIGQRISAATLRKALVTLAVFVALFAFFYGPALTPRLRGAAHDRCNTLTGDTYRSYRLEWETTSYHGINRPHWMCIDLSNPNRQPINLGWWVDL
jgi:hypothetical protein